MNHRHLLFGALCALCPAVYAVEASEIDQLDYELQRKAEYDHQKHLCIESIQQDSSLSTYNKYALLFEQYQSFNYDTAFSYVNKMLDEARLLANPDYQAKAELKRAFIYLSSGLFHESLEVFKSMDPATLNREDRIY